MSLTERQSLYKGIETHRKRPLIVYVTSGRPGANGMMAQDAVREFADQLKTLPSGASELDVLINSYGGDGPSSWRLVTMIREHLGPKGKLTCLVPYYAFSAATLFAVGCDQIFLHPMASLLGRYA
jgi:ClpP class serine protease